MGFLDSVGGFLQKALPIVSAIAKFVPGLQAVGTALGAVSKAFGAVNALTKKADESDEKADDVAEKAKAVTPGVAKAAAEFSKTPETRADLKPVVADKPPASIEQQKLVVQALQDKWAKTSEGTGAMGKDQIRRHVSTEFNVDKDLNTYRANHGGKDLTKEDLANIAKKLDTGIPITAQ